jgi:hypothetical protein
MLTEPTEKFCFKINIQQHKQKEREEGGEERRRDWWARRLRGRSKINTADRKLFQNPRIGKKNSLQIPKNFVRTLL